VNIAGDLQQIHLRPYKQIETNKITHAGRQHYLHPMLATGFNT